MSENLQAFNERLAQVFKQETKNRLDMMRLLLKDIESAEPHIASVKLKPLQLEVHSLKGAARSVEQRGIELLCQDAETLLINTRESENALSTEALLSLHELIDYLDHAVIQSQVESIGINSHSLHVKLHALATAQVRTPVASPGNSFY